MTARANSGYTFVNWTENGSAVSSSPSYTLTLNANQTLVANFAIKGNAKLAITSPKAGQSVSNVSSFWSPGRLQTRCPWKDVVFIN